MTISFLFSYAVGRSKRTNIYWVKTEPQQPQLPSGCRIARRLYDVLDKNVSNRHCDLNKIWGHLTILYKTSSKHGNTTRYISKRVKRPNFTGLSSFGSTQCHVNLLACVASHKIIVLSSFSYTVYMRYFLTSSHINPTFFQFISAVWLFSITQQI